MSHQVPAYFRYVSSITINNPGSGYTAIPTITISGGGGTGATATASIYKGHIQAVNITNIGENYTTSPTVTATGGGGSNSDLSAVLAFAAGTPSEYEEKSAIGVKYTLPEFVQNDYDKFVAFIEKYYEYMDSDGNPINLLLNKQYNDIDELNDAELNKRALELAENFPQILQTDRKSLLKKIKNIYESKGSERSIKAYFKLLYDEEVEIYYPSKNILRASDGVWLEEKSVSANPGYNNYEALNLGGQLVDIVYSEYAGAVNVNRTIQANITKAQKISYTSPQTYELFLDLPASITSVPGPGSQATATATIVAGEITEINVTFGGYEYLAAPGVVITDTGSGVGAIAKAVVSGGQVTSIVVENGGSGYSDGTTSVSFDTESIQSFIIERNADPVEESIRAYLKRSLFSVTSGTYSGVDAGFSVGDFFAVTESGYVTPGNFVSSNNALIRVAAIDPETNVPTMWTVISPGEGFTNAQTVITITSKTGEDLDVTLITKYLFRYAGKYKGDRGKLSDVNRLQDNFKYQSFSYVIKSSTLQSVWGKRFRDLMHPAGMEVFSDIVINNNINFAPFISIRTDGLDINLFKTTDVILSTDSFDRVIQWVRVFTENQTATQVFEISLETPINEVVTITDEYDQDDYAGPDYLPTNYVGSGVSKLVGKNVGETIITSEVFTRTLDYVRTLSDTATVSEQLSLLLDIGNILADSTNAATDVIIISAEPNFSESASIIDDYADIYVEGGYLPLNYVGPGVSVHLDKSFTELPIATESLERAVSFNRVFTDTGAVSDASSFNMELNFNNQVSVSEAFSFLKFRPVDLSDTVHIDGGTLFSISLAREFISDNATHSEFVSINTEKTLVDASTASEANAVALQKPFTETGNIADSGVITIQDYSDPTYFSEDYVGAGYNF